MSTQEFNYETLRTAITTGSADDMIAAIQSAHHEDLEELIEEYDLETIGKMLDPAIDIEQIAAEALAAMSEPKASTPSANSAVKTAEPEPSALSSQPSTTDFDLSQIDGTAIDLQQRDDAIDHSHVDDIKAAIAEGTQIEPIDIYIDVAVNPTGYIADGWHRYLAHKLGNKKTIPARIHTGGKEGAFRASLSANAKQNARPRRRADIRKAVKAALGKFYFKNMQCIKLPKSERLNMTEIAELCICNQSNVSRIAKDMEEAAKPVKGGETKAAEPQQRDFFASLDAHCKSHAEGFQATLNHTYFLSEEIPNTEKLKTLESIQAELAKMQQAALDLKAKLAAQEEAVATV